jgi:aryl-alcohol dehydrogenase-like predicted oxidoreductase
VVFSPLAQGVLTGKYKPGEQPPSGTRATDPNQNMFMGDLLQDTVLEAVQRLGDVARDVGCSLPQLALAWVLRQPNVSSAIIGASRPQQVDENVKAAEVRLSEDVLQRIDEVLEGVVSYG